MRSCSRSTTSRVATDCTRPAESPGHHLLPEHRATPRSRTAGRGCAASPARRRGARRSRACPRAPARSRSRDLVEHHPPHRHLRLQLLEQVPGDRLALAVLVRREQELVGVPQLALELGDDALLVRVDDVLRLEALLDRRRRACRTSLRFSLRDLRGPLGQVADVPDARLDHVIRAQVAGDGLGLGRRFDDDERLGHRDTLAPSPEDAAAARALRRFGTRPLPSRHVPTPVYTFAGAVSWPVFAASIGSARPASRMCRRPASVLAANHTSNFDPWPLGFPLWPRRQLYFMAKSSSSTPVLAPTLRAAGAFPVRRGETDIQAVQTAVQLCKSGKIVAMFPEGTRRQKGLRKKLTAGHDAGAARIALAADVPLVPAAIKRHRSHAQPATTPAVAYGPADSGRRSRGPAAQGRRRDAATQRLMAEIEALYESL